MEKSEIENRLLRYSEHFSVHNADIIKKDIIKYLEELELYWKSLDEKHVCFRKLICKCKFDCLCDTDFFVDIKEATFMPRNDCKFEISLMLSQDLKKIPKGYGLKIFFLREAETTDEITLAEIDDEFVMLSLKNESYDFRVVDSLKIQNNTFMFTFDYLSFQDT